MIANGLCDRILIAGFGGQGVLLTGRLLAQTAMEAGRQVTFMPSYGAEVRGGTTKCMVTIADEAIGSPVFGSADAFVVMNQASLDRYLTMLKPGGLLILNDSQVDGPDSVDDYALTSVPADEIAQELDSPKSANMVILGAYLQARDLLSSDDAIKCLPVVLAQRYHSTLGANEQALRRGAAFVGSIAG